MVIVNEPKESIHFCTQKLNACYELPLDYLKQIMNISNVIDYGDVSKWTVKPFNIISSISGAFREMYEPSEKDIRDFLGE